MERLYRRGKVWWAAYQDASGRPHRRSLFTIDRAEAATRLRDARKSQTHEAPPAKGLGKAIGEMLAMKQNAATALAYRYKGGQLIRVFGDHLDINDITRAKVADYCKQRLDEGAARHTIHKELVVLRQTLKEAASRNEYAGNITALVPNWKAAYTPKTRWLTPKEFAALLEALPRRRTWLMIQAYTGAELAAMKRLTWAHVDLAAGVITIPGTKRSTRHRAGVPLHPELAAYLAGLDQKKPLVEPWKAVAKHLRDACDAAGIKPRATTTDLRRTFGSWLVQAGVDLFHVSRLMGHSSTTMVARVYGQLSDASFAAAVSKLPPLGTQQVQVQPKPAKRKARNGT